MKFLKRLINLFTKTKKDRNEQENKDIKKSKRDSSYITINTKNEDYINYNKEVEDIKSKLDNNNKSEELIEKIVSETYKIEKNFEEYIKEDVTEALESCILDEDDKNLDKNLNTNTKDNIIEETKNVDNLVFESEEIIKDDEANNQLECKIELEKNEEVELKSKLIGNLVNVINDYSNEKAKVIKEIELKNKLIIDFINVTNNYSNKNTKVIKEITEKKTIYKAKEKIIDNTVSDQPQNEIELKDNRKIAKKNYEHEVEKCEEIYTLYKCKDEGINKVLEDTKEYDKKQSLTLIKNSNEIEQDLNDEYYRPINIENTNKFSDYGKEVYVGELGKIKIFEALTTDKKLSLINIKTWKRFYDKPLTKFANENFDELEILIYANLDEFREAYKNNGVLLHKSWYMNPITVREKMYEDITFIFRYSENYLREKKGNSRKLTVNYTNKFIKNINEYLQKNCELIYEELEKQNIEKKLNNKKSERELNIEDEIEKLISNTSDNLGFDISLDVDLKDIRNNVESIRRKDNKVKAENTVSENVEVSLRDVSEDKVEELDEIIKGVDDFII